MLHEKPLFQRYWRDIVDPTPREKWSKKFVQITVRERCSVRRADRRPQQKGDKVALVAEPHAAAHHEAVVIFAQHAVLAQRAMMAPYRHRLIAAYAVLCERRRFAIVSQSSGEPVGYRVVPTEPMKAEHVARDFKYDHIAEQDRPLALVPAVQLRAGEIGVGH